MLTRVKICGITRPEDAALAGELGADAVGLNLFAGSRRIDLSTAAVIVRGLPPLVTPVALTACSLPAYPDAPTIAEIRRGSSPLNVGTFQVYGEAPEELLEGDRNVRCWMVYAISSRESLRNAAAHAAILRHPPAAMVVDTASEKLGGSGKTFNWNWIAEAQEARELVGVPPLILAGGLTPENVADAIRIARPYAVDVSSGVEIPGKPGIKDPIRMRDFIQAVKSV